MAAKKLTKNDKIKKLLNRVEMELLASKIRIMRVQAIVEEIYTELDIEPNPKSEKDSILEKLGG